MTIEIPTPSAELLHQLETATIETDQAETSAVASIRERFARYAKHNGYIKTAHYNGSTQNYNLERDAYYMRDGRKVRGLLVANDFDQPNTTEFTGDNTGTRLYLTENGDWLELERAGHWSQWQNAPSWWYTDHASWEAIGMDEVNDDGEPRNGGIRNLSDGQVAAQYRLKAMIETLAASMAELCKKIPERYGRLKASAELAQRVVAGAQVK